MNPKSTDCEAVALITLPSRRLRCSNHYAFEVDLYFPIIDQILSSMKTQTEGYDRLQKKFSFLMELNIVSNCKIEASVKKLLYYCPDDMEKSLPEEMIHFSTLIKQHHVNSECKEIQKFK